jgi:hypothetical protein
MAYIAVRHELSDTDAFWHRAAEAIPQLGPGMSVVATWPSQDRSQAICLWEAESVDALRDFLDSATEGLSHNEYFEVDTHHRFARGVPHPEIQNAVV